MEEEGGSGEEELRGHLRHEMQTHPSGTCAAKDGTSNSLAAAAKEVEGIQGSIGTSRSGAEEFVHGDIPPCTRAAEKRVLNNVRMRDAGREKEIRAQQGAWGQRTPTKGRALW